MQILPTPPPAGRVSIKQAKANFKSRNYNPLSERDKKQLERAAQLDRRAFRVRETEKRRIEDARRREQKAKQAREEREKLFLDSQRRCDRFGYKSSQLHLGAFFGAGALKDKRVSKDGCSGAVVESNETFPEDELDDATLLEVCDSIPDTSHIAKENEATFANPAVHLREDTPSPHELVPEDMESLWDELDSSTQIARDLEQSPILREQESKLERKLLKESSFGSVDFDLSVEEIDSLLQQSLPQPVTATIDSMVLMPPPPAPLKLPPRVNQQPSAPLQPKSALPTTNPKPLSSPNVQNHDLTLSQLESFVDDDLQLTQFDYS